MGFFFFLNQKVGFLKSEVLGPRTGHFSFSRFIQKLFWVETNVKVLYEARLVSIPVVYLNKCATFRPHTIISEKSASLGSKIANVLVWVRRSKHLVFFNLLKNYFEFNQVWTRYIKVLIPIITMIHQISCVTYWLHTIIAKIAQAIGRRRHSKIQKKMLWNVIGTIIRFDNIYEFYSYLRLFAKFPWLYSYQIYYVKYCISLNILIIVAIYAWAPLAMSIRLAWVYLQPKIGSSAKLKRMSDLVAADSRRRTLKLFFFSKNICLIYEL